MNIVHYSLGFPPFRTGGMTKFCMDLIEAQMHEGNTVTLIWPGRIQLFRKKTRFKLHKPVEGIGSCEIINPLPIPYDEGITDIDLFLDEGDKNAYRKLFEKIKPDVIHIHTFMGLHKAFIEAAKEKGIFLAFTTHDFFPVCPRVTLVRDGRVCVSRYSCDDCAGCNSGGLSYKKMIALQSPVYQALKDSGVMKKLRSSHRRKALAEGNDISVAEGKPGRAGDYIRLRNHYHQMLKMIDKIHYNSSVTAKVYGEFFDLPDYAVVPITHAAIGDHKEIKKYSDDRIRIRYLGGPSTAKGFYLLLDALDLLWKRKHSFQLDIHFMPPEERPYMNCHGRYDYSELGDILNDTDVLVCPSIWFETFGYTVLEALSYGVPVIISDNVGAKDILAKDAGIIIDDIDSNKLFRVLDDLTAEKLSAMNRAIVEKQSINTMDEMVSRINKEVYTV